jgi:hypothetical protein
MDVASRTRARRCGVPSRSDGGRFGFSSFISSNQKIQRDHIAAGIVVYRKLVKQPNEDVLHTTDGGVYRISRSQKMAHSTMEKMKNNRSTVSVNSPGLMYLLFILFYYPTPLIHIHQSSDIYSFVAD